MATKPFFSHDFSARNDMKIRALRAKYGTLGYGLFWLLVEAMAEQEGYKLPRNEITLTCLAADANISITLLTEFIDDCISSFSLFLTDDKSLWSESLRKRLLYRDQVLAKKREAGRRGGLISASSRAKQANTSKKQENNSSICLKKTKHMLEKNQAYAQAHLKHTSSTPQANSTKRKRKRKLILDNSIPSKYTHTERAPRVLLADSDFDKLPEKIAKKAKAVNYSGKWSVEDCLTWLSDYAEANEAKWKKYTSHRAVLDRWAIDAYLEDLIRKDETRARADRINTKRSADSGAGRAAHKKYFKAPRRERSSGELSNLTATAEQVISSLGLSDSQSNTRRNDLQKQLTELKPKTAEDIQ